MVNVALCTSASSITVDDQHCPSAHISSSEPLAEHMLPPAHFTEWRESQIRWVLTFLLSCLFIIIIVIWLTAVPYNEEDMRYIVSWYSVVTYLIFFYQMQNLSPPLSLFPPGKSHLFIDVLLWANIYCNRCPVGELWVGGDGKYLLLHCLPLSWATLSWYLVW